MGKLRTYKVKIQFEGYVQIYNDEVLEDEYPDRICDEKNHTIIEEVLESEYDLPDYLIEYLETEGRGNNKKYDKMIEELITAQNIQNTREERMELLLKDIKL